MDSIGSMIALSAVVWNSGSTSVDTDGSVPQLIPMYAALACMESITATWLVSTPFGSADVPEENITWAI